MRRLISFLFFSLFISNCFSQVPQSFRYQAVARDTHGNLLKNKSIQVNVAVLDQSGSGTLLYKETHAATTNAFGLFNLSIGTGSVLVGTFSGINWAVNDKFLSLDIDFGSGFVPIAVSQLLSVPYALYSGNPMPGPTGNTGPVGPIGPTGATGATGASGTNGLSLVWKGSFANAPTSPLVNDAYYDTTANKSFVWDGTIWQTLAQDGSTGASGSQGIQGVQGVQGVQGANGLALSWKGSFGSAPIAPLLNDAYYDTILHKSFVWNGVSWNIVAQDGNTGATGIQGLQGLQGNTGATGASGLALLWLGSLATAPANPATNTAYYNTVLKSSYVFNGTTWSVLAKDGNTGPQGSSYLKVFQFVNTPLADAQDTSDIVIVQISNPWIVLPAANAVPKGKIICFLQYLGTQSNIFYLAGRGTDKIMSQIYSTPQSSIYSGGGTWSGSVMLVSDGVSLWYVIRAF